MTTVTTEWEWFEGFGNVTNVQVSDSELAELRKHDVIAVENPHDDGYILFVTLRWYGLISTERQNEIKSWDGADFMCAVDLTKLERGDLNKWTIARNGNVRPITLQLSE